MWTPIDQKTERRPCNLDYIRAPHQSSSEGERFSGKVKILPRTSHHLHNLLMISFLKIASKLLNLTCTQIQSIFLQKFSLTIPESRCLKKKLLLIYGSRLRRFEGRRSLMNNLSSLRAAIITTLDDRVIYEININQSKVDRSARANVYFLSNTFSVVLGWRLKDLDFNGFLSECQGVILRFQFKMWTR